jgi:hypothetical protein
LDLLAHLNRRQWEQGQDVVHMLEAAAASDPDVARMLRGWKEQRAGMIREALRALDSRLRPGLAWSDAAATARALSSSDIYAELVAGEGWNADRYESWLAGMLREQLLRPAGG